MHQPDAITHHWCDMFNLPEELWPSADYPIPANRSELERLCSYHDRFKHRSDPERVIIGALMQASIAYQRWLGTGERLFWWQFNIKPCLEPDKHGNRIGTMMIGRQMTTLTDGRTVIERSLRKLVTDGLVEQVTVVRPVVDDPLIATAYVPPSSLSDEFERMYYVTERLLRELYTAQQQRDAVLDQQLRYEQARLLDVDPDPSSSNGRPSRANGTVTAPKKETPLWLQPDLRADDGAILYQPRQLALMLPPVPTAAFVCDSCTHIDSLDLSPIATLILHSILQASLQHWQWCWLSLPTLATMLRAKINEIPPDPGTVSTPHLRTHHALVELHQAGLVQKLTCRFLSADNRPPQDAREVEAYCITDAVASPQA